MSRYFDQFFVVNETNVFDFTVFYLTFYKVSNFNY